MERPLRKIWAKVVAKKTFSVTIFFVLFAAFLAVLFIFQMFFANQNYSTKPTFGSVVSQPTETQVEDAINTVLYQELFFKQTPTKQFYPFSGLQYSLNVSSSYIKTVISNSEGFDFAPTVLKEGNTYKMWWCGVSPANSTDVFNIYYATSNDTLNWSPRIVVLQSTKNSSDSLFVCQPTVVKVNSTYYMYYTGTSLNISNSSITSRGSIFLATSNDGKNWTKYQTNSNPQAVIVPTQGVSTFVNLPSVLYYNNKFYLYYTNSSSGNGTDTFLATSSDGKQFTVENNAKPVFAPVVGNDKDVKFLNSIKTFFMVYGSIDTNKIFWSNSTDGINWLAHDNARTISTKKYCSFGPGILTDVSGNADMQTVVYYAAGDTIDNTSVAGCVNPTSWTIDATSINITTQNVSTLQAFNATNFKCTAIKGGYNCKFDYVNTFNESAIVLFLFTNYEGSVISTSIPIANQGISQVGALVLCEQLSGTVRASWRVYRMSDITLANPLVWSKSTERQTIICGV